MILRNYNLDASGPHTLVLAGVHGDETNSVKAVGLSNFKGMNKSITVMNVINEAGLKAGTRELKEPDNKINDLNRLFSNPEDSKEKIVDRIKTFIKGSKIVIDVHSSPACSNVVLLGTSPKELIIKDVLDKAGVPCVTWNSTTNTIRSWANSFRDDTVAVTIELNGMGQVSKSDFLDELDIIAKTIDVLYHSYEDIIRRCSSKQAETYGTEMNSINNSGDDLTTITARTEGIVNYLDYGELFKTVYDKDDIIGSVMNLETAATEMIRAPYNSCVVVDVNPVAYAYPGTELMSLARLPEYAEYITKKPEPKPELKAEAKAKSKPKNTGLLADEKTVGYAFECEKDFANWCAENIGETVHGVVADSDEELDLEGYREGVTVVRDATPFDNFINGDVRTNCFKADVKSSKDYSVASISAYIPVAGIETLMKLGKTEQAAWRILALEYLEQNDVDYYISYGKDEEVNVIPKKIVLDMLSEEGLKLETKVALGEVKSLNETRTIKNKVYLSVYLPLTSWASQYAFRKQFMTLEDLVDLYK
jgi:predicted deacylase